MFSIPSNATPLLLLLLQVAKIFSHHIRYYPAPSARPGSTRDVSKWKIGCLEALDLSRTGIQAELEDRIKRKEEVTEITTTHSTPQYAAIEAIVAKKVVVKDVPELDEICQAILIMEGELAYLEEETNRWGNEERLSL